MHIVTPDFLTGAKANLTETVWTYEWRRKQNMTGLERKHTSHREIVQQTIDGEHLFNINMGCDTTNCSSVQDYAVNKQYQRIMNPFDCLTAFSTFDGNRSDVIFVSSYDYLWNMSTSVPHFVMNGSSLVIYNNASSRPGASRNTLLFSKDVNNVIVLGFWMEYDWLCGNTNSFDCELCISTIHSRAYC
jgi:hypothetical protein